MKTKKFLLVALVLGINTLFAQNDSASNNPYPAINQTTNIGGQVVSQTLAQTEDSLADSASAQVLTNDSLATDTAAVQASTLKQDDAKAQPLIVFGWPDSTTNWLIGIIGVISLITSLTYLTTRIFRF